MGNIISRTFAIGISKTYYKVENEFEAVGTLYSNWSMHYVAAHPTSGLWLCAITQTNTPIPIGFVNWNNIKRIVVDDTNEQVFIVVNNYDEIINNADFEFRKIYKGAFTHTMKSEQNVEQEKSFKLPLSLFSGNILPYLQQRCQLTHEEIKEATSIWPDVCVVVIFILIALSILARYIF